MKEAAVGREQAVIAHGEPAEVAEPREGAFHDPAPTIPTQTAAVLIRRPRIVRAGRNDRLNVPVLEPPPQAVAVIAAIGALVLVAAFGLAIQPLVRRIPRSALQLAVGLLLTTFGTFWAVEGVGVDWPGSDAAIVGLLGLYVVVAAGYLTVERAGWSPRTVLGDC